ncbi:HD domain-containing protein [Sphaerochaeta pleomorpha]|uniref:HD domain-containing protein n=1 Tax=Sphaerochaeta pleomorpha TaxID=1131707 RepID=UPI001C0686A8|nr:HD domain-containing protein [Sphaerochaeta pleomorpha]
MKNYPLYSETTLFLFLLASLSCLHIGIFLLGPFSSIARPHRREFFNLTGDILSHTEFNKLKGYFHHSNHIYDHVVRVAYISYSIARVLGLDYKAAARGGLLHDFFLYDWRERKANDISKSLHGKEHPYIALENAQKYFEVSDLEADIIVKHMFPKTRPIPRYKESFVVSISDKIAAIHEYLSHNRGRKA